MSENVTSRLIAHMEKFGRVKFVGPGMDGTLVTLSEHTTGINVTVEIIPPDDGEDDK